ncbi:MAG: amidohydrolase [Sulfitobacter sp.]
MSAITLFQARKIITMDPGLPEATHVAVKEGRILAIGGADCADQWGEVTRDDSLKDSVLMPGFVEGHAHMMAGKMWDFAYAGYHDRIDPQGNLHKGMTTIDAVIERLSAYVKTLGPDEPLIAWGFDPIFLPTERLNKTHLDAIAGDRAVAVLFSNFHLMCVNSVALEQAQYSAASNLEGVLKGTDGQPTGELQEMAAMFPVMRRVGLDSRALSQGEDAMLSYAEVCKRAGVTTVTDLYSSMEPEDLETMIRVTNDPSYAVRIVPALGATGANPQAIAERAVEMKARSTDKLRLGAVKIMTDGSIQGWTARVKWPGYVGGQPNGLWNTTPEEIFAICETMQREGVQMHIHVNGDEAAEVSLNALEAAKRKHPWPGARHVLQHCQMMGADMYRRAAEMGTCVNVFANHLWYFGDKHAELTLGEAHAQRMNDARAALDAGAMVALHSDAPVTPLGPLFTAWCAVNRQTMSGKTLGPDRKITVEEALRLITMGAAVTLKMDADIGSIEIGKYADFAVLGSDPRAAAPEALKDVEVRGTVCGGEVALV